MISKFGETPIVPTYVIHMYENLPQSMCMKHCENSTNISIFWLMYLEMVEIFIPLHRLSRTVIYKCNFVHGISLFIKLSVPTFKESFCQPGIVRLPAKDIRV